MHCVFMSCMIQAVKKQQQTGCTFGLSLIPLIYCCMNMRCRPCTQKSPVGAVCEPGHNAGRGDAVPEGTGPLRLLLQRSGGYSQRYLRRRLFRWAILARRAPQEDLRRRPQSVRRGRAVHSARGAPAKDDVGRDDDYLLLSPRPRGPGPFACVFAPIVVLFRPNCYLCAPNHPRAPRPGANYFAAFAVLHRAHTISGELIIIMTTYGA